MEHQFDAPNGPTILLHQSVGQLDGQRRWLYQLDGKLVHPSSPIDIEIIIVISWTIH
jgi:hypothetical protein